MLKIIQKKQKGKVKVMFNKVVVVSILLTITGCASVTHDSNQGVRIDTKTQDGQLVTGANCRMTNNFGLFVAKSGETSQVHRSSKDLEITCKHENYSDATAKAISRSNSGMWGNIIIGGGIGAIIDHNSGKAYNYPEWMQLIFGEHLYFDRSNHEKAKPTPSTDPDKKKKESDI